MEMCLSILPQRLYQLVSNEHQYINLVYLAGGDHFMYLLLLRPTKPTPNGCLVSGPVDFQIRMRAVIAIISIMKLSDEMFKSYAVYQA